MLTPPRTTAANGVSSGARHRIDCQGDRGRVAGEHRQSGSRAAGQPGVDRQTARRHDIR